MYRATPGVVGGSAFAVRPIAMKQKCQACGVEKDTEVKEIYPYPDDGIIVDEPI
jgi:hypothetical protein